MPRQRYQFTDDVPVVHRWVHTTLRDPAWLQHTAAYAVWEAGVRQQPTAARLQQWCTQYLAAARWEQLQAVIHSARRQAGQRRTIRLTERGHARLHALAARERLTLSEAIERYLTAAPAVSPSQAPSPAAMPARARAKATAPAVPARTPAKAPAAKPPKQRQAFVTAQKGVCYLTVKSGRLHFQIMRIYNYTIDADAKRRMRRLHPDVLFDWQKIARQLAEKREVCRRYRSRRRRERVPREREPFYGVYEPSTRRIYVNDPDNAAGAAALLDALLARGL